MTSGTTQNNGERIAVIGAGVAGLTTALELSSRRAAVTVYSDRARPGASWVAPALFTPYAGGGEARFRRWTEHALRSLTRIASDHGPESGVHVGPLREYLYKDHPGRNWLDSLLGTRLIRPVPEPCVDANVSNRPHIDMLRYMPWLEARARSAGVEIVDRRVRSLDEVFVLGHRVVVNCSGMGARELASDPLVRAMHGQVVHVPNDVGLEYSLHDDSPGGLVAYIFVFRDRLVLGGTFDAGREDLANDRASLDQIIGRCRELLRIDGFPRWQGLARHEIRALAAVRPTRGTGDEFEQTRVERDERPGGRTLVHNYGHGRAGATMSWATAKDAADLVAGVAVED